MTPDEPEAEAGFHVKKILPALILLAMPMLVSFGLGTHYERYGNSMLAPVVLLALVYVWVACYGEYED